MLWADGADFAGTKLPADVVTPLFFITSSWSYIGPKSISHESLRNVRCCRHDVTVSTQCGQFLSSEILVPSEIFRKRSLTPWFDLSVTEERPVLIAKIPSEVLKLVGEVNPRFFLINTCLADVLISKGKAAPGTPFSISPLILEMRDESLLVGFADDVDALIAARNVEQAILKLGLIMARGNECMQAYDRDNIAPYEEENSHRVPPADGQPSFPSMRRCSTQNKAAVNYYKLSRPQGRLLLLVDIISLGARLKEPCLRLSQVQVTRSPAVTSGCHTVSEPAVLVIAGVISPPSYDRETDGLQVRGGQRYCWQRRAGCIGRKFDLQTHPGHLTMGVLCNQIFLKDQKLQLGLHGEARSSTCFSNATVGMCGEFPSLQISAPPSLLGTSNSPGVGHLQLCEELCPLFTCEKG
ncbi:hypothetical protein J6590_000039 [Homalodisca vitripennis]|nr:hypothetical protein J6590_000039 [Homalodisca vitripennis]